MKLPRKDKNGDYYLSYSQISSFLKDKKEYFKNYFIGDSFEGNAFTDFGSKVGVALEKNDFSGFDEDEIKILKQIPRLDIFEKEIRLNLGGFYILGYIDSTSSDLKNIIDYKTGNIEKKKKDYESEDYIQLDIYALGILQETGELPDEMSVVLIDRKGNPFRGDTLKVGDKFIVIPKNINKKRLLKLKKFLVNVAKEISDYYEVFEKINIKM